MSTIDTIALVNEALLLNNISDIYHKVKNANKLKAST